MTRRLFVKYIFMPLILLPVLLTTQWSQCPAAAHAEGKPIQWDFSLFGAPRGWTFPLERWAKDMERLTNGGWKIKLHYGAVLSPEKQQLDGIKAGAFQACQFCSAYTPGKLPLHSVMELPFISPHSPKDITAMVAAMWEHPALIKELEKWNAVPLLPGSVTIYNLMGSKRIEKVDDFKGVRVRIGGDIAEVLKKFGAAPTMIPAPEIYEAISRGTLDMVGLPWSFAFGAFKIHEVSKYAIVDLNLGTMACAFIANKAAWNSLPAEYKKIHQEWYKKAPDEWGKEYDTDNRKWIEIFKKKLEFIAFPPQERAKLVREAESIWEKWAKGWEEKGHPARDVLKYYLSKRKAIAGY
jgi:TRAP-type C4-dicarboxylate transport system substrate-binding protein